MSLKWLLSVVGFFAISSVAVAKPSAPWMAASVSSAVLLLTIASVVATVHRSQNRFELGFAIGGWIYLGLMFAGAEYAMVTTWVSQRGYAMATGASLSEEYYTGAFARNPDSLVIFVSNKERRGGEEEAVDAGDLFGAGGIRGGGLGAGDAMSGGGYGGGGLGGYGAGYGGGYNGYGGGGYFAGLDQPEMPPFARYMHVAHCMWAISFASCCGVLAARQRLVGISG